MEKVNLFIMSVIPKYRGYHMAEQKTPKDMSLGELVYALTIGKDEVKTKLVDENHPRPETWDKHGGIHAYNNKTMQEYEQRREALISELNRRESLYQNTSRS